MCKNQAFTSLYFGKKAVFFTHDRPICEAAFLHKNDSFLLGTFFTQLAEGEVNIVE